MPIKNYTTDVPVDRTINDLHKILAKAKAKAIMTRYSEDGEPNGVSFVVVVGDGDVHFQLPVNVGGVAAALKRDRERSDMPHARRVAWRIVKDWVDSQMGLIASGQADIGQVFLPYAKNPDGSTVYELFQKRGLLLTDQRS